MGVMGQYFMKKILLGTILFLPLIACSNDNNYVKRPVENMDHLTTERLAEENARVRGRSRTDKIVDKEMDSYFKDRVKNISDLTIKSVFGQ